MAAAKAAITTHVLDQTTGLPAAGVRVTLGCDDDKNHELRAATDSDGRITSWELVALFKADASENNQQKANDYINSTITSAEGRDWTLTFWTEPYFANQGKKSFWSKVKLGFTTDRQDGRQHWHVPLLLGPFGYTTYRGS